MPPPEKEYRPIADECIDYGGYSLSKGSYIENGSIVGSPCDPVGFCGDKTSNDNVVRDYCEDIWTDNDDPLPPPTPTPTPTDYCYLPGVGDWWDNPDCKEYLENKNDGKPIPVCTLYLLLCIFNVYNHSSRLTPTQQLF
jgi:hypothetical protein